VKKQNQHETLLLSNQLCHRFYVLTNAITRAYRPVLDALDITYPQYLVLLVLWENEGVEVGVIKQLTRIDGGALTQILKKLHAKGVIQLTPSDKDKRIKLVSLTSDGRALKARARDVPAHFACLLEEVGETELASIKQSADKLIDKLAHFS